MEFLGQCILHFTIPTMNKTVKHKLMVLEAKTYKTLLWGRDFFKKMGPVTMDVGKNCIKLGDKWINGEKSKQCIHVRAQRKITLPARSENFACINGTGDAAMLDYEFVPAQMFPPGVYVTNAGVRPDLNGDFIIPILNVNEYDITLNTWKQMGNLIPTSEGDILHVNSLDDNKVDPMNKVQYGKNLNPT